MHWNTRIKTTKLSTLMWLVGFATFFLSDILDNLTTTIVMISLMRKLMFFLGLSILVSVSVSVSVSESNDQKYLFWV